MLAGLNKRQVLLKLLLAFLDSTLSQFINSFFLIPLASPLGLHRLGLGLSLDSVYLRLEGLKLVVKYIDFRSFLQSLVGGVLFLEMDGAHLVLQLMNKIQKVRLVTLKSNFLAQQTNVNSSSSPEQEMRSIHSYFVMLRHIFQKNKNVMRRRNEFMRTSKVEVSNEGKKAERAEKEKEKDGKRELCIAITQQCLGIQRNSACDFKKKQVRQYRPYRSKNHSVKVSAKTLHTSTPNLHLAKEEEFTPIGDKFKECRQVIGESLQKPTSTSRSKPKVGTCVNFHPRYEKLSCCQANHATLRGNVKRQRRTLLIRNKPIVTEPNQGESLRQSHKSAYSNKSYISVATEASEVPSPW